jgi:magnesium chelatase accessory protein
VHWHLQVWDGPAGGAAPRVLLLHGTGASSHSWRAVAPLLAAHAEVLVPDLPGHGFTRTPASTDVSLPGVATALAALLRARDWMPTLIVGHSAGAAIGAQLVLQGLRPRALVSVNGAWLPLQGPLGTLFLPIARVLAGSPLAAPGFATWAALPGQVRRLLRSTGSSVDALGERCYRHLVTDARHVAGALRLMASWDLAPLEARLGELDLPVLLMAGSADSTLPPEQAARVQVRLPDGRVQVWPGRGHLAHEEDPQTLCDACAPWLRHEPPQAWVRSGAGRGAGGSSRGLGSGERCHG